MPKDFLHISAQTGNEDSLARLLSTGVPATLLTRPDRDGLTPFHHAAYAGHDELFRAMGQALQDTGESVSQIMAASETGWTPAHIAAQRGHHLVIDAVVAVFWKAGQAAEVPDVLSQRLDNGRSAADIALRRRDHRVIAALRRGGVRGLPAASQLAPVPAPDGALSSARRSQFKPTMAAPAVPLSHHPGTGPWLGVLKFVPLSTPSAAAGAALRVACSQSPIRYPGH